MPTDHFRWRKKIAKKAREQFLDDLYAVQNSLCWWCKSQCALMRYVSDGFIKTENGCVFWQDGPHVFKARIATVDHVRPVRDGGRNEIENLVMACLECNNRRTPYETPSPKPEEILRLCPDCFGEKAPKFRRCGACSVKKQRAWLAKHGWAEVASHDPRHSKFIDPVTGVSHVLSRACRIQGHRLGMSARLPGAIEGSQDMN